MELVMVYLFGGERKVEKEDGKVTGRPDGPRDA
jgi:hypothetical protein